MGRLGRVIIEEIFQLLRKAESEVKLAMGEIDLFTHSGRMLYRHIENRVK